MKTESVSEGRNLELDNNVNKAMMKQIFKEILWVLNQDLRNYLQQV